MTTCSANCKSSLSRKKRQLADRAFVDGFGWRKGVGAQLIARWGLKRAEWALNQRGLFWQPQERAWVFVQAQEKGVAA